MSPDAREQHVFTDTHAHLTMVQDRMGTHELDTLLALYATCAPEAFIVDIGTKCDDFFERKRLFELYPFIALSAGIWPDEEALKNPHEALKTLEAAVSDSGCAAVGECGLDYHWMNGSVENQEGLFSGQVDLAVQYDKPLIVHSREAHSDTLRILRSKGSGLKAILHCFSYGPQEAGEYLESVCYISFSGNVTYKKAEALREALALVPDDRLLIETDAPYMNPEPRRGKPCSPRDIVRTYELAARIRGQSLDHIRQIVHRNAVDLFPFTSSAAG